LDWGLGIGMGAVISSCIGGRARGPDCPRLRTTAELQAEREILSLARSGAYHRLKALLDLLASILDDFQSRRASYLSCRDRHGRTPLILAARHGHHSIAELLISLGADLDVPCACTSRRQRSSRTSGMTALHVAVAYRRTSIAMLLVEAGASPFIENEGGLTAHDMVIRTGLSLELLRLIESRGVYAGWVEQRVGRSKWARRWGVISPRVRERSGEMERGREVKVVLCLYEHLRTFWSPTRMWVDGARASGAGGAGLVTLGLAPEVGTKPKGCWCRKVGGRWTVEFRADAAGGGEALEEFRACLDWGASLGSGGGGFVRVNETQSQVQSQVQSQQHWASQPPGFLSSPEVSLSSISLTASTTSTSTENGNGNENIDNNTTHDKIDTRECLICLDRPVQFVFTHADGVGCAVACADCNGRYQSTACPVCRRHITARVKVFGL